MSLMSVKEYLKKYNMADKVIEFSSSSATVELAARELSCEEGRIAKTLAFDLKDRYILIVTSGDKKIDNAKYKSEFQRKAKMIDSNLVLDIIGHPVGGVCPFDVKDNIDVYLDVSLKKYDTVYPACGTYNSAIKLTIDELENIVDYKKWIDVCK